MDFLIFGHVGLAAKVIKVSRVGLRVEFRHERSTLIPEVIPVDLGKIWVGANLGDALETGVVRGDTASMTVSFRVFRLKIDISHLPLNKVPCSLAQEVIRVLVIRFP